MMAFSCSPRLLLQHVTLTGGCPLQNRPKRSLHRCEIHTRVIRPKTLNAAAAGSDLGLCDNGLVSYDDLEAKSLSCAPDVAFLIPSMPSDTSDVLDCPHIRDLLTAQVCVGEASASSC